MLVDRKNAPKKKNRVVKKMWLGGKLRVLDHPREMKRLTLLTQKSLERRRTVCGVAIQCLQVIKEHNWSYGEQVPFQDVW